MCDLIVRRYRALAAMVIIEAIRDAQKGQRCGRKCRRRARAHVCSADALAFLESDGCRDLLQALDVAPGGLERILTAL